ncbi:fras1-related extracellular matrix protein 3 [Limosa lapponica baueri]|uniref:Fras1-related extracellular matrix protein 3 n=1 Tax=Limosa lapponica baueri TaxID=1758121 RepID=A0A2I0TIE7_LIMLA|nr:fras1-related extracellular matrix protein 3 [Limosa lapponica baueri]
MSTCVYIPIGLGFNDVTYTHFGARSPGRYRLRLQLRYDSPRRTIVAPFTLEVEVLFQQLRLLSRSLPLPVEKLRGLSAPLDGKVLGFPEGEPGRRCRLTLLPPEAAGAGPLPAYGRLLDAEGRPLPVGYSGECSAVLQAGIRYQHTAATASPSRDCIPARVSVLPASGPEQREYFQVLVRIREGADNTPPKPSFLALLMMEVDQFALTALTLDMLAAEDLETPPDLLIFNLTSSWPSDPRRQGFLLSTDDPSHPLVAFSQQEVRELKIAYQPPTLDSDQERLYQVEMEVLDPDGASSEPFAFVILVKPMNTLAPVATFSHVAGPQLMLFEGQSRPLSGTLEISDEDNLKEVKVWVIRGLHYGKLNILGAPPSRKYFTAAELAAGQVIYQHDGSEHSYSDNIVFRMADGQHQVEFLYPITIAPDDDQPPLLNANTGLVLSEHQTVQISPFVLSATDVDSDDASIRFVLVGDSATSLLHSHRFGELLLRQAEQPASYESKESRAGLESDSSSSLWHFVEDEHVYERVVNEWLQQDILDGRLFFRHMGAHSASPVMGHIAFQLQDDNDPPNRSGEHVLTVKVKPVDNLPPALYPGTSLQMTVQEYQLTVFKKHYLRYTDLDTDDRELKYTLLTAPTDTDENHPVVTGEIVLADSPELSIKRFTQAQVNHHKVAYRPPDQELGITPRVVQFTFLVEDSASNSLQEPLSVLEGGKSTLTLDQLDVEDTDTPRDDILCIVTVQSASGYLENVSPAPGSEKSRAGTSISAFSIKDVRLGHVNYVQSIHKGLEPVEDRFTFQCSDGVNFSPHQFFPIVIIPTNDEKPELFVSEFMVLEGMSLVIDTPILNGADADVPPDELRFVIAVPPKHGRIVQQLSTGTVPVHSFTLEEIQEASSIVYEHDDSETKEDSFQIQLTDGHHTVEQNVPITVILVDDETPRMAINNGLEVEIGKSKVISSQDLKATDIDSEDKSLVYVIRLAPVQGFLQHLNRQEEVLRNITQGMNFTQGDLDQGFIRYVHTGLHGVRDLIKFDVTDGINALIDRYFYITIGSIDTVFPEVINKGVTLKEGGKVTLTTDLLSTSDVNSPDENLRFSVTRSPTRGHLENSDSPGVPVVSFTQLQLAGNKIYYIHTAEDEVKMDSFEFEVTDGHNPVFRTFRVSITDVDNKKPILTIGDLVVEEGETRLITPFELTVDDGDTPDHLLLFTVTQVPVHGQILYNNSYPVTSFTKQDLNENLISYRHDGTETSQDSFSFSVTDGTHTNFYVFPDTSKEIHQPQMMRIQISSLDNRVPQLVVNKGAPTLRRLPAGHLGFLITSKVLKAEDRDSPHKLLKYKITDGPEHGFIVNTGLGNESVRTFMQADIDEMKISYVLKEGDNATSDIFYFSIEDNGGNVLKSQPFRLNWAWISLEKENYVVDENSKFLEVTIRRRGYLQETSFINGTAVKDKDFKGKPQKQVQFNPGQVSATWRVRIFADKEYEASETFQIVLSDPVMAALEVPAIAMVEIVDPGDVSTVYIPQLEYRVEEDIGELLIPVRRSGDVSQELMVICSTHQGMLSI